MTANQTIYERLYRRDFVKFSRYFTWLFLGNRATLSVVVHHVSHIYLLYTSGATSFSRNVILPNRCLAEKKNITERNLTELPHSQIGALPKLYNAEQNFSESSYDRMSFSRIVIQTNVIFLKYHLPERHVPEIVWSRTSFHRTLCELANNCRIIQETIRVTYR